MGRHRGAGIRGALHRGGWRLRHRDRHEPGGSAGLRRSGSDLVDESDALGGCGPSASAGWRIAPASSAGTGAGAGGSLRERLQRQLRTAGAADLVDRGNRRGDPVVRTAAPDRSRPHGVSGDRLDGESPPRQAVHGAAGSVRVRHQLRLRLHQRAVAGARRRPALGPDADLAEPPRWRRDPACDRVGRGVLLHAARGRRASRRHRRGGPHRMAERRGARAGDTRPRVLCGADRGGGQRSRRERAAAGPDPSRGPGQPDLLRCPLRRGVLRGERHALLQRVLLLRGGVRGGSGLLRVRMGFDLRRDRGGGLRPVPLLRRRGDRRLLRGQRNPLLRQCRVLRRGVRRRPGVLRRGVGLDLRESRHRPLWRPLPAGHGGLDLRGRRSRSGWRRTLWSGDLYRWVRERHERARWRLLDPRHGACRPWNRRDRIDRCGRHALRGHRSVGRRGARRHDARADDHARPQGRLRDRRGRAGLCAV